MLQLTFNPGLTLTSFRTTRPRNLNGQEKDIVYVREKSGNFISRKGKLEFRSHWFDAIVLKEIIRITMILAMFFLDEEDTFIENIPVSNEWESLEAAAISHICIYFSGSEKIYFYLFS